jgi:formate dehydrogenase maturation protein FdhE
MEAKIHSLFDRLDPEAEQTLLERLEKLTKRDHESYNHYIWRLLETSHDTLKRLD